LEKRWRTGGDERAAVIADLDTWLGCWRDALLLAVGQPDLVTHRAHLARLEQIAARPLLALRAAIVGTEEAITRLEANVNPRLTLEAMVGTWPQ